MPVYLADNSYLGLKVEATPGTAVIPDTFVPLVSENIKSNVGFKADRRMKGLSWKSDDLLQGDRKHEGEIVIYADSDNLGHFLNMTLLKGTTTGGATGYTHPFTVGEPDSYTIEIQKGPFAIRYFGVKADSLRFEFEDGLLKATASIKARGQFSVATLKEALSGSVTSLKLAHNYDDKPNSGLVAGDVISLKLDSGSYQDITLTSVNADGETVGFGALSITAAAGNPIYLKAQTPSYTGLSKPLMRGDTLVGISTTSALATTAAGAKATATPIYDLVIDIKNNLFDAPATGSKDPYQLLTQMRESQITISRLFESEDQRQKWLDMTKQAITSITLGSVITGGTTKEQLTIKLHKVKLLENNYTAELGSLIQEDQSFEALYDADDAIALEVSLVNKTAGTSY